MEFFQLYAEDADGDLEMEEAAEDIKKIGYEKNRIDKFNAVCFTAGKNSKDSFYNAIIFGVNQKLKLKCKR